MSKNDSKTITLSAKRPLDIGDWFTVSASVGPTARYIERNMEWMFAIDKDGCQLLDPDVTEGACATSFNVRTLLNVGDSLYIESKNGPALYAAMLDQGKNPDAVTIGAFWQVQEDGSLICTGT